MDKYFDGMVIKTSKIINDKNNWKLENVNSFLKTAYYIGINQAEGLGVLTYFDDTENCTIERYY